MANSTAPLDASQYEGIRSARLMVGMEVHVELSTRTKMFTRTPNVAHPDFFDAEPNSLVDPVVAALPGAMPTMNKAAVEMSMMVGLALNCRIAEFSKWDRKNYFYPDLPKGYQISQFDLPLCLDGSIDVPRDDGTTKTIGIIRAHLEEDTGKLSHELPGGESFDGSLVDLNRAGTPLLEIVTQPDMESAEDAVAYGRELRSICCFLGVTPGIMQRGHMRFEPNINVIIQTDDGKEFATPIVEIKNLNSFRAVKGAIEFEYHRQIEAWRADGIIMGPGAKTTRGWDDARNITVLQRSKEDAHDYRYFPEPDLIPVITTSEWVDSVRERIPELPIARRARYARDYELDRKDQSVLTESPEICAFYESSITACHSAAEAMDDVKPISDAAAGRATAKMILNAGAKRANEVGAEVYELGITPAQIGGLVMLRESDTIGSSAAAKLFDLLCEAGDDVDPMAIAEANGLIQVQDDDALDAWVTAAIEQQPQAAEDFAAGKDAAAGRLMGSVMKASKGQADAKAVQAKLRERLRGG